MGHICSAPFHIQQGMKNFLVKEGFREPPRHKNLNSATEGVFPVPDTCSLMVNLNSLFAITGISRR